MEIPQYVEEDLEWCRKILDRGANPVRRQKFRIEIFSDASLTGWGAACREESVGGLWAVSVSPRQI